MMITRNVAGVLSAIAFALATGCGGEANSGSGGGGGGDPGATGTGGGMTDSQYCADACSTLIGCGVGLEQTACTDGCLSPNNPGFLACVKTSPTDCNSVALCSYQVACGAGNTPSGTATCQQTQDCVGSGCIGNPDPNCGCTCTTLMSPSHAVSFYILTTCSTTFCNAECGPMGSAAACGTCLSQNCPTEDAQCN